MTYDADCVGYDFNSLGNFYEFYVNNTFYLLAPDYYRAFYSNYLNRCLSLYDGWVAGWHNRASGLVPQRMLQSIARGLNNMLFAQGIDFSTADKGDYAYANKWAKESKFGKTLKKAHLFAIAGGTSLLKLNRENNNLYATAHRIDTFFPDIDANGKIVRVRVFFDAVHNTTPTSTRHYGICEERYFDKATGKPMVKACVYQDSGTLQTSVSARPKNIDKSVSWTSLPLEVRDYINKNYPSIIIDKPQYLPFYNDLGCRLIKFTDDIPQIPNTPFGQPIGDTLLTESFQYDQMKYFEKNEVDLAKARALVPEQYWNKDDDLADERGLNERFYQKIGSVGDDTDKITPIQFQLRGSDIKTQKENIYNDCAFKLNVSASTIATFLSDGAGARTATEIVTEKTKSDTWLKNQINLNKDDINEFITLVMRYYNHDKVEIIFNSESQSPFLDKLKVFSDVFSAGNMTPEKFVRSVYSNDTTEEQDREIEGLKLQKEMKTALMRQSIINPMPMDNS